MQEDNLYPNDGEFFGVQVSDEQTQDKEREQQEVIGSIPVLNEIVKRFDDRIEFFGSVRAYPDDVKTDPAKFMHTVAANDILVANLESERDYIKGLIDEYVKTL